MLETIELLCHILSVFTMTFVDLHNYHNVCSERFQFLDTGHASLRSLPKDHNFRNHYMFSHPQKYTTKYTLNVLLTMFNYLVCRTNARSTDKCV